MTRTVKFLLFILVLVLFADGLLWIALQQEKAAVSTELAAADSFHDKHLTVHRSDPAHAVKDPDSGAVYVDNELILSVGPDLSYETVSDIVGKYGGAVVGINEYIHTCQILFDKAYTPEELNAIAQALQRELPTAAASRNYYIDLQAGAYTPDDSEWNSDWGDTPAGKNWGAEAIHAPELWSWCRERDRSAVYVGILDNQFYTEHEDLEFCETWLNNFNIWSDGFLFSHASHGTHVAGTVAATMNNGKGVAGIAGKDEKNLIQLYGTSIHGLQNEKGITVHAYEAGLVNLIAGEQCKVINVSYWGGLTDDVTEEDLQITAHIEQTLSCLIQEGCDFLIAKASGNSSTDYAGCDLFSLFTDQDVLDRIITVGAAELGDCGDGREYHIWSDSNYGETLDLLAPGSHIHSSIAGKAPVGAKSAYGYKSGTSMATPHVTGTAAAIWSVYPDLTGPEMKRILCESAKGDYYYAEGLPYHYPMLDAYAAIQLAAQIASPGEDADEGSSANPDPVNEQVAAMEAYLAILENEQDLIDAYDWSVGNWNSGEIFTRSVPKAVAFANVYGDEMPELIYIKKDPLYSGTKGTQLVIVTYADSRCRTLYSEQWDVLAGGGFFYYLFQVSGDKALYAYVSTGDEGRVDCYERFEENGQALTARDMLKHMSGPGSTRETYANTVHRYEQNGQSIGERAYFEASIQMRNETSNILMFSKGGHDFPVEIATEENSSAMTCEEAIALLTRLIALNSASNADWSEAYRQFVVDRMYLRMDDPAVMIDATGPVRFGLYNLDRDSVPELIVYNGSPSLAGALDYVFRYQAGMIQCVGTIGTRECNLYRFSDSRYPGLLCTDGNGGIYSTYYYSMQNDQIMWEHVLNYDQRNAVWDRERSTWTGDTKIIRITQDDALFDLEVNGLKYDFKQFTYEEINAMGWEAFVDSYRMSDEKTIVYKEYSTQFGQNELSISSVAGVNNKNMAVLCAMLSDAAYSDGGTALANLYRDMFEGDYCDLAFDYADRHFCSAIALGEKTVNNEKINILVVTVKGTQARVDIPNLDIDLSEIFADLDQSKTKYKGFQAFRAIVDFETKVLQQANELIAANVEKMDFERPLKIIVTGHSLGGAVANLMGATYNDAIASGNGWWSNWGSLEDIYCYSFGAINALDSADNHTRFPISEGYENIHNIVNVYDEMVAVSNIGRIHGLSDGKFGHNDWFARDNRDNLWDNLFNMLENHQMYRYLEAVAGAWVGEQEKMPEETPEPDKQDSFSISGSWKSIGKEGFGQAQPGMITVFEGDHCNFFSPYDTFRFYAKGNGRYQLDVTSFLFGEELSFDVRILDNNNIEVDDGYTVTKLRRTDYKVNIADVIGDAMF